MLLRAEGEQMTPFFPLEEKFPADEGKGKPMFNPTPDTSRDELFWVEKKERF